MLEIVVASAALLLTVTFAGACWVTFRALPTIIERLERHPVPPLPSDNAPELAALNSRVDDLFTAVSQGILHVDRSEKRVQATIRRARSEFADGGFEHDGLEAEHAEFSVIDGGGSEGVKLPPVPPDVAGNESSIPGVSIEQLRAIRGLG